MRCWCGPGVVWDQLFVEGCEAAVYARAAMPKQLKAILADGTTSRTLDVPPDLNMDDMYEVQKWFLDASQEWLRADEGNSFLRRDAVIEFRVIEPVEPFAM